MEEAGKLCCQADYFETSEKGKVYSSLIVYSLFEYSKLKTAMNRQFILQFTAFESI
jgi:hypothetical protein